MVLIDMSLKHVRNASLKGLEISVRCFGLDEEFVQIL
jgi:hypothetical protein